MTEAARMYKEVKAKVGRDKTTSKKKAEICMSTPLLSGSKKDLNGMARHKKSENENNDQMSEERTHSNSTIIQAREEIANECELEARWVSKVSPNVMDKFSACDLEEGSRVEMFWKQDVSWYSGLVTNVRDGKFRVDYDDGFEELDNMEDQQWRIVRERRGFPQVTWELTKSLAKPLMALWVLWMTSKRK